MLHRTFVALLALFLAGCPDPEPETELRVDLNLRQLTANNATGAFLSVWAGGPDNVWIVGGSKGQSSAVQLDGNAWTTHTVPVQQRLWWVHGLPGGETVFVAGEGGAIAQYAGGAWSAMDSTSTATIFYGIWAAAPDDAWAVSGEWPDAPAGTGEAGLMVHYDGKAWSRVTISALEGTPDAGKDLFKVWGASSDAIFVVGANGIALHYDGTTWRREDTGGTETLFTVWGRSATDVYAVGGFGTTKLIRWDGSTWTRLGVPEFAPQISQGLWTAPGHSVYIAGMDGYTARLDADGSWHESDSDIFVEGFHAIRGDGTGIWAAGGDIITNLSKGAIAVAGRPDVPSL